MSIEKRNKKDITQMGDVLSGENKGSMGIARRICYTNAKLAINAEKISIQRRAGACSRRFLYTPFRIRRESVVKPIIVSILPFAKSFEKMLDFSLPKILHIPFG